MFTAASIKVSVIIPAYNSSETIGETLRSLAAQAYREFEVIVVDDGSGDDTAGLVERDFPEVRLVRQENGGPAAARNAGAALARGEWLAFLDADDVWLPWRLAVQMKCVNERPEVEMWCGRTVGVNHETHETHEKEVKTFDLPLKAFVYSNPVATSTVLVRRELFAAVGGFDTRFRGPEDYDLWIRLAAKHKVVKIDMPVSRYRETPDGLSQDERKFLPEVLRVIDRAYGDGGELRRFGWVGRRQARAYQFSAMAWNARMAGRGGAAVRLLLRSVMAWPLWFPYQKYRFGRLRMLWNLGRTTNLR